MKTRKREFKIIALLSIIVLSALAASPEVTINYVSASLNGYTVARGSIGGGTVVYISGVNFSPIAGDISIFFGNYPCTISAEGSNVQMVSCITTPMTGDDEGKLLPITMHTVDLLTVKCTKSSCSFAYYDSYTPRIYEIYPYIAAGNQDVTFYGIHRISNIGDGRSPDASDLRYQLIGDTICSNLDIIQEDIAPNQENSIYCKTFLHQQAGEYNATQRVLYGDAVFSVFTKKISLLTYQFYSFRIAPWIDSTTVIHSGGTNGHILHLTGTGFSNDQSKLGDATCKIGGVSCSVLSMSQGAVTIQLPPYQVGYENLGKMTQDPSDTEAQQLPFLGSAGFKYTRYRFSSWKNLGLLIYDFRAKNQSQTVVEEGYSSQLSYLYRIGVSSFTDYQRGYFYAHADGQYLFQATADDQIVVFLSKYQGTANIKHLQIILSTNNYMPSRLDPFQRIEVTTLSTKKTLQKGYYYMQVIARDGGGGNFYYVNVATPPTDAKTNIPNPTWQIVNVKIAPQTKNRQTITITVDKAGMGATTKFNLFYLTLSNDQYVKVSSGDINVGATVSDFQSAYDNMPHFNYGAPQYQLKMYDSSDAVTTVTADAVKFVYTITYEWIRPSTYTSLPSTSSSAVVAANIQAASPGLGGTYTFSISGAPLSVLDSSTFTWSSTINIANYLPYLGSAIQRYYPGSEISLIARNTAQMPNQLQFDILMFGVKDPLTMSIDTAALTGGTDNTIDAVITQRRAYSGDRPYFHGIPYELMRTGEDKPAIQIGFNDMPALCVDCTYSYQATSPFTVVSAAFIGFPVSGMSITLAYTPSLVTFDKATDVVISLYGEPCNIINELFNTFTCTFNTITTDQGAISKLPAGDDIPKVHIKNYGFATVAPALKLKKQMTISSITPLVMGFNGEVTVTAKGTGFPVSSQGYPKLKIKSGTGNPADVTKYISITNTQVDFKFPTVTGSPSSPLESTVVFELQYPSYTYSHTSTIKVSFDSSLDPTVTALSIQSASPILKQTIDVTGTNFDPDITKMRAYLYFASNQTMKYQITILPDGASATQIKCLLGGGRTGDYNLRVEVIGKGISSPAPANAFSYKIVVNSVSPVSGTLGGGYTLTINGANFATAPGSTNVFIGDGMNSICKIATITSTKIECTVPQMNAQYKSGDQQTVLVTGRIIEESLCEGTCIFTYLETGTIHLNPLLKTEYQANEVVTIQADSSADISTATVKVGTTSVTLASAVGDTITFPYPPLTAGSYDIVVTVNGNNAYPTFSSSTALLIGVISSTSGSNKGQILNVIGNGFSTKQNPSNQVQYICSGITTYLPILTMIPTNVTFQVPSNPLTSCTINVTMGLTFKTYTYAQNAAKTPSVAVTQLSTFVYQITASNTNSKSIKFVVARFLDTNNGLTSSIYPFSFLSTGSNQYSAQPQTPYLPCGTFKLQVHFDGIGYADSTTNTLNSYASTACQALLATTVTQTYSSFNGGGIVTINQAGFITNDIQNNDLRVCRIKAAIKEVTETSLSFQIPPFVNQYTHDTYGLGPQIVLNSKGNIVVDSEIRKNYPFDKNTRTYYESINQVCFIGLDFGSGVKANIRKIRFFPNGNWIIPSKYFVGAILEGSNDNTVWTPINEINPQQVHTGWNTWIAEASQNYLYQYVRFRHVTTISFSACQLAQLQFTGTIFSNTAYTSSLPCPLTISFNDATKNMLLTLAVIYKEEKTSTVTSISPSFGPSVGGTVITITGTNFDPNPASVSVVIDGITCVISTATATQIVCTTGMRSSPPSGANTFELTSWGSKAILKCEQFLYIDRWSSSRTWGDQAIPRDGDTVYVPKGMALLIDQSTPHINLIYVDGGKVIFSDEADMTLDANYFIFLGGEFRAGLPNAPYQHKLTITLHGGYYDKQLPYFGNKVLGCQNCRFNMHGKVRTPTWTELSQTITPGSNTVKLIDAVDWVAGEHIAVAASGYNHFESEERIITAVADAGKTLTVDKPFTYRHFSGVETYGGKDFVMRAEVGLLTRNIVIQGDNMSEIYNHGSHLMFMGKAASGLDATLSYTEITQCGQPKIVGRYCSHFHMAGEVPNSFVRGIAVHHSHARVLTIHGTHYLLVEKNVGFLVKGHNIFIEDGIETRNIIQDNLMISSIASLTLLQSDTSVASYWITNPFNTVRRNHAAGGDFYGFWYEIKPNPDGPSATPNVCPTGMQLGESANNVAHSNRRFGLRVFIYAARQFPCVPVADQSLLDPFSANPAYESVFDNYLLWKNQQSGFLGQQMGYVTTKNFLIIDSGFSGMEFFKTNITKEPVTVKDTVIVGISTGNPPADLSDLDNVRGIITPRTDGLRVEGVTFANFGAKMTPLQSCSQCTSPLFWVTGGKSTFFKNIKYVNIQGDYIFWNGWRRQIFIDEDGSLTKPIADSKGLTLSAGTITPYFDHLNIPSKCYNIVPLWDNSSFCDNTITIRSLLYTNVDPSNVFVGQTARTALLSTPNDPDAIPTYDVQSQLIIKKSKDIKGSWAYPYAVGKYYHTHFQFGIDFLHMSLAPSQYWGTNQGIVIRFNYTDVRQFYNIGKYFSKKLQQPLITAGLAQIDPDTCSNGDYYHDKSTRHLYVCVSGKNKAIREWIDITGIRCKDFCPKVGDFGPRQDFTRVWSNAAQWPNGVLPAAGDNVDIPYEWNIILDMDTPALGKVLINGLLYFKKMDLTFQAKSIWVNQGGIFIGKSTEPFPNKATIILNGEKDDPYTLIDAGASGNKMLAVTGGIQFYGITPKTVWTRLTAIAPKGATTITVQNLDDWAAGQQIVIGPTYSNPTQDQVFKIVSISGKVITLNDTLKHEHYGAPTILANSKGGKIDLRAAVGMMTRNIKITKGHDANNWGCRVLVYSYLMTFTDPAKPIVPVNGYAIMDGIEMDGCGQYDTSYAGLRIQNIGKYKPPTNWVKVTNSAIRNCNGNCAYIDKSQNVIIDNNIFHFARRYIVYVLAANKYTFTNNVLIGLRNRPHLITQGTGIFPETIAYSHYISPDYSTSELLVNNNFVQGSEQTGFVFPFTSCDLMSTYPFAGNTAGSCVVGVIANVLKGKTCIGAAGFSGYANEIGFIANPPGGHIQVEYDNMFFVDNQRGFTLRYAHETDDNTIILRNSYMMGYSRPTCASCYSDTTISYCKSGYAIRMFTVTISGQQFPFNKDIHGFDVICTQQSFDGKAFLTNVTFQNYKYTNTEVPYCSQMSVFRKHDGASDATANHNLRQSECINCDLKGLVYFSDPQASWSGWAGGCGQFACTGSINYLIHDQDGMFTKNVGGLSQPSQLMANNQPIGDGQSSCTKIAQWNGYWCKSVDFATFEYQSIAADFNARMVWPITMKYDGGSWTSVTNGWREWVWIALNEPGNKRLARFWTIVKLGKQYNLTYASQPPSDSVYQIQKRQLPTGNPNDWIVLRIYFPVPNAVLIRVTNTTLTDQFITGFKKVEGAYPDLKTMGDFCGANHFNFQTNVISFVVNGKNNCKVRLTLASYLQLTVRLNTNMATFYSNDGQFSVLSKIIAFLKIDPAQLKIVGVRSGSVVLDFQVYSNQIFNETKVNTNETDPNNKFYVQPLRDTVRQSNQLSSIGNMVQTALMTADLALDYPVISTTAQVTVVSTSSGEVTICPPTFLFDNDKKTCYCDKGYANITKKCISCTLLGNTTGNADPANENQCECPSTLVWSSILLKCTCTDPNMVIGADGKCFNCKGLANSKGKPQTVKKCLCNPTFVFTDTNTCSCPDAESYIDGGICYGCSQIGINSTGKVLTGQKQCQCKETYIYIPVINKCYCQPDSYVDLDNRCKKCLQDKCKCTSNLVFKPALGRCACFDEKSAVIAGVCYSCVNDNSTGIVIGGGTECQCKFPFSFMEGACRCHDLQSVLIQEMCFTCRTTNYNMSGKGLVPGTNDCSCRDQFDWDPTGKCVCGQNSMYMSNSCYHCDQFPYTFPTLESGIDKCLCKYDLVFDTVKFACACTDENSIFFNEACTLCTSTAIRGLARVDAITCSCDKALKFVWDRVSKTCACDSGFYFDGTKCSECKKLTGSTSASILGVGCVCKATLSWDPLTKQCFCNGLVSKKTCLSCDSFIGAVTLNPNNKEACLCVGQLTWDGLMKKKCTCGTNQIITYDGSCLTCSTTLDANIVAGSPATDLYNCKCADPFFWDNIQNKCIKCGTGGLENSQSKTKGQEITCKCMKNFAFDVYTNKCLPVKTCTKTTISECMNCALIPFGDGMNPSTLVAGTYASVKDTKSVKKLFKSVSSAVSKNKSFQCYCSSGFIWDTAYQRCRKVLI